MRIVGKTLLAGLAAAALTFGIAGSASASGAAAHGPSQHWSHGGLFGTFDRAALRRGFQVYKNVCAGCHGLRLVAYRNLMDIGFSENEVKAIAAEVEVRDGPNDDGEMFDRPGQPSDRFKSPFANDNAARASNNGALPPDLSLIVKARLGGADYIYGVLTGYKEAPAGTTVPDGMHYNESFPGHMIAMPAPLSEDGVEYADKTKATVDQQAKDVTTFLAWTAEPELEARKRMGVKTILFLLLLTGLLYVVKRRIWADVHH
jgi:ubiquinol-cytochrome c reductase cytochrome c1 subunit